jgi:hypothetical protein
MVAASMQQFINSNQQRGKALDFRDPYRRIKPNATWECLQSPAYNERLKVLDYIKQ